MLQGYFLLMGLGCFGGGWWLFTRRLSFFMLAGRAQGEIVDCVEYTDHESGGPLYDAIISFSTVDGGDVRFTASRGNILRRPQIGALAPVYYNKERPEEAFVADFIGFWAAPIALWLLGLAGIAAGIAFPI